MLVNFIALAFAMLSTVVFFIPESKDAVELDDEENIDENKKLSRFSEIIVKLNQLKNKP